LAVSQVTGGDLAQAVDTLDDLVADYPLRPDAWVQRVLKRINERLADQ
jgi:hypothetical protein